MARQYKVEGKGVEDPHPGAATVTGIVTFPFGIQHAFSEAWAFDDTFYGYIQNTPYCSP